MESIIKSIIITLLLVSVVAMLGCTTATVEKDTIVGSWGSDALIGIPLNTFVFTFNTDNTIQAQIGNNMQSKIKSGSTWKNLGGGKYRITSPDGTTTSLTLDNGVLAMNGITFHQVAVGATVAVATPLPIATPIPEGFSRTNPANIGDTIYVIATNNIGTFEYNIELEQVIRGAGAWNMIKNANMYNSAPDSGKEYLLAKFKIQLTKSPNVDTSYYVNPTAFDAVSSSGSVYDLVYVVDPEPELDGSAYSGGSTEGWVTFEVAQGDNPLIVYDRNYYSGTGGLWFKTS